MTIEDRNLIAKLDRMERLLDDVDSLPDTAVRARVVEIVQTLMAVYGEGLARILSRCRQSPEGAQTIDALAQDDLVSHLLLLHDLHPVDLQDRVAAALDSVRPYLESHGGNVELIAIEGGIARVRLVGSCKGCPSSTQTLKSAIEEALYRAAPDLVGIEAEGAAPPRPANFVPLAELESVR